MGTLKALTLPSPVEERDPNPSPEQQTATPLPLVLGSTNSRAALQLSHIKKSGTRQEEVGAEGTPGLFQPPRKSRPSPSLCRALRRARPCSPLSSRTCWGQGWALWSLLHAAVCTFTATVGGRHAQWASVLSTKPFTGTCVLSPTASGECFPQREAGTSFGTLHTPAKLQGRAGSRLERGVRVIGRDGRGCIAPWTLQHQALHPKAQLLALPPLCELLSMSHAGCRDSDGKPVAPYSFLHIPEAERRLSGASSWPLPTAPATLGVSVSLNVNSPLLEGPSYPSVTGASPPTHCPSQIEFWGCRCSHWEARCSAHSPRPIESCGRKQCFPLCPAVLGSAHVPSPPGPSLSGWLHS
ncbi:uncharacterized protein LOC110347096 [Heterocephalus glaber]|uniref:Uncharacterized protein LOC110347096 n=1 Tax=Heterocephalus glaber TaxID=10181 RepID=A0AAX6S9I2_HETGA|nr:uncharacterized protein LOC110347096 [Heterocephalus glaber]